MNDIERMRDKSVLINQLIDLITGMPQAEQFSLLKELENRFSKYKRKHFRKTVRTTVEYITHEVSDKGFMQDISVGGVFIETRMPFRNNEPISLSFVLPDDPKRQIKVKGRIARISPRGIGIAFANQANSG